ncbi:MAG: RAMP superfamily CRISPR-associated protein [Elainella sp.]
MMSREVSNMTRGRPNRPRQSSATQRPNSIQRPDPMQRPNQGGSQPPRPPARRQGSGSSPRDGEPSPWLQHPLDEYPDPDPTASFVEYLRWMRSRDHEYENPTKVQILQLAEERANYSIRLAQLIDRTRLLAGSSNCFEVSCPWRIRVGGHRGPESILLPAFDATGMPYIPSTTLRGVARTQAIREMMSQEGTDWQTAERRVASYFGALEAEKRDQAGKVIFFDAYPLPSRTGGLKMDIATAIWKWQEGAPVYDDPNPNPFFSLAKTSFLIGLKLASTCQDPEVLQRVRAWLIAGLAQGVGSQVNTGYGELSTPASQNKSSEFLRVAFSLEGQLIHGSQRFKDLGALYRRKDGVLETDRQGKLRPDTIGDSEVRATAFKSILRYWFRAFALGVLNSALVEERLEPQLFGSITHPTWGWVRVEIRNGNTVGESPQTLKQPCHEQRGTLALLFSPAADSEKQQIIQELFKNLTWMMFHLGGVGQGARRPCYFRGNPERAKIKPPFYRGSTLFPAESENDFWDLPESQSEFCRLFKNRLRNFYQALSALSGQPCNSIKPGGQISTSSWSEVVDANCKIVVCSGPEKFSKPYALSVLHDKRFKLPKQTKQGEILIYDPDLCGTTDSRPVRPSPIWIADLGNYQVVTVFGATQDPRARYLATLRNSAQIFPLT